MKRLIAIILALSLLLCGLTACSDKSNKDTKSDNATVSDNKEDKENGNNQDIEMLITPDFIGLTVEEAEEKHGEFMEQVDIVWINENNSEYAFGVIFDQSEVPTKKVKPNTEITLYISKGIDGYVVPDLVGKTEAFAVDEIFINFTPTVQYVNDNNFEEGLVVKTLPESGTVLEEDAEVIIYVSSGQSLEPAPIPNVIGLNEEDAIEKLEKAGFTYVLEYRDLTADDKYYEEGFVFDQLPKSDEDFFKGAEVILYISTGLVNYDFAPTVSLSDDFKNYSSQGYISLWINGEMIDESPKLDFNHMSEYTFKKISITERELSFKVRVKFDEEFYEYADIVVDASSNKVTTTATYTDYQNHTSN